MAGARAEDVAKVFNYVWMQPASLTEVAGVCLFAFDLPHTLRRYKSRQEGSEAVWTLRFEFTPHRNSKIILKRAKLQYGTVITEAAAGLLRIVKLDGDTDQFQKDWVMIKMHNHVWDVP